MLPRVPATRHASDGWTLPPEAMNPCPHMYRCTTRTDGVPPCHEKTVVASREGVGLLLDLLLERLVRRRLQLFEVGNELGEGLLEVGGLARSLGRIRVADDLVAGH